MTHLLQAAAVAAFCATSVFTPVRAHAEDAQMAFNPATLATPAGRAAVDAKVRETADRFCRSHPYPVGGTVASCRVDIAARLSRQLEMRAEQWAKARPTILLSKR